MPTGVVDGPLVHDQVGEAGQAAAHGPQRLVRQVRAVAQVQHLLAGPSQMHRRVNRPSSMCVWLCVPLPTHPPAAW